MMNKIIVKQRSMTIERWQGQESWECPKEGDHRDNQYQAKHVKQYQIISRQTQEGTSKEKV